MFHHTIYIGEPLRSFFTTEPYRFGVDHPETIIPMLRQGLRPSFRYLVDELPLLKDGYADLAMVNDLIYIYSILNLRPNYAMINIYPDEYMNYFFGDNIPALRYKHENRFYLMDDAIAHGYINHPVNTYDSFHIEKPNKIAGYEFTEFVKANILELEYLDQDLQQYLKRPDIKRELEREIRLTDDCRDGTEDLELTSDEKRLYFS